MAIRLREDNFLESNLKECNYDNGYVFGVYDGDIEQFINRYMAVNSSCFAKSAVHYKEQGHHFLKCIIITNYGISMEFNQCFFLSR